MSGDLLVAGAPVDDVGANGNQGSAYVFERNHGGTDNWGQVKKLVASGGGAGDQFGFSVSVSGDVFLSILTSLSRNPALSWDNSSSRRYPAVLLLESRTHAGASTFRTPVPPGTE